MKSSVKLLYTNTAVYIYIVGKPQGTPEPLSVTRLQNYTHILAAFIILSPRFPPPNTVLFVMSTVSFLLVNTQTWNLSAGTESESNPPAYLTFLPHSCSYIWFLCSIFLHLLLLHLLLLLFQRDHHSVLLSRNHQLHPSLSQEISGKFCDHSTSGKQKESMFIPVHSEATINI